MILVYFPSDGCVNNVVNNRTNRQFTSVIVVHFINSARVCWIIKRTVFNMYVCLNYSWRYKQNQFQSYDKKPRHQRQFSQNLTIFIFKWFSETVKESYL